MHLSSVPFEQITKDDFLAPIPCTHTSLPLDGMAKNDPFISMDMQDHAIYGVWIHFSLPPYTRGEKNHSV